MRRPFVLIQFSDPHIGATWAGGDPSASFAAAVSAATAVTPRPDAILLSGDLADHAEDAEYRTLREILAPLRAPTFVVPGNHDDRRMLRRHFELTGGPDDPICESVALGPLQLVLLDTTIPGATSGTLDRDRLARLESALAAAQDIPTMIAMHHPPVLTGMPPWDAIGLDDTSRELLATVLARHRNVRLIVAGHVHRTFAGELGGRSVLAAPSTYGTGVLDLDAPEIAFTQGPPGFVVHVVTGGALVSHVQSVSSSG